MADDAITADTAATVVITGAASGIGRRAAVQLAAAGRRTVIVARSHPRARAAAAAAEADPTKKDAAAAAQRAVLETEAEEYQLRVNAYPTDLPTKFELGRRCVELGRHEQ
ncbi:MAG TPA: SDR family NAD(P)-dependent oxidoreductase, partial [Euzebyales bacterium]|nr:SDR family NAD(P)-dependent oxidoreductase [Euzebyales bacterium]